MKLQTAGITLRPCVHCAAWEGALCLTTDLALRWATQPQGVQPAHGATRLGMVRGLAQDGRALDSRTAVPPHGVFPSRSRRQPPDMSRAQAIAPRRTAARQLHAPTGLRPSPYATLLGWLTVTGMRLSAGLHLERDEVERTQGRLTRRQSTCGKTRWMPRHPSTQDALQPSARVRDQRWPRPPTWRCLLAEWGTPLTVWSVQQTCVQ